MSWKALSSQLTRLVHKLRERIHSFGQLILFLRILSWWGFLRLLQPFLSVQQMVGLATYGEHSKSTNISDVVPSLQLLYEVCRWTQWGDCLPRTLVSRRFLKKAGIDTIVIIGFNGEMGHSWVDLGGKPFLENEAQVKQYQPALILRPEDKTLMKAKPTERNVSL